MSVDFLPKNFPPFQVHHAKKPPRFYPDGFQRNVIDFYLFFRIVGSEKPYICSFPILYGPYGDGIKKVLSIASGIAKAVNGILLIDEVETAIHSRYYEDVFRFIISACQKFDVQVFITSHSLEAIDSFLSIGDYDNTASFEDPISVVTLKKELSQSYARVLSGRHVYQNREQFGFEVRL